MKKELWDFVMFVLSLIYRLFHVEYIRRHHLFIEFKNHKLKVKFQKHKEYADEIQALLDKALKKYPPEKFITYALEQSIHCAYITFSCELESKFIQFLLEDGNMTFDYPMWNTNEIGVHKYQVLGLLAEMGFYRMRHGGKLLDYYFEMKQLAEGELLTANFVKDIELATKFTSTVFKDFYGQELNRISATVG